MGDEDRQSSNRRRAVPRPSEGRDEFNLAEFPLTVLADRVPRGLKSLEWEDEIVDKATSQAVRRKVLVTGSDAYGLPTGSDADVLFALIQLTKVANNFTSRDVPFSRYELLRILDWRDEGKSYRRLEQGLNRWVGTTVYFSAWRDKETETWRSEKFHLLDNVTLMSNDNRRLLKSRGQQELALSSFSWNQAVFRNLRAGYVCPVDLDVYFTLKSAISKRILRYLGKHFRLRQQRDITFDLRTFAFEKIGLSRSYRDSGQIKKELQLALDELEAIGFLEPMDRERRYTKVARGEWTITLVKAEREDDAPIGEVMSAGGRPAGLVAELVARGVTRATAADLVAAFPTEHIEARIEVFDWLTTRKDRRVSTSPAGYLAESIRKGYAAPKGFESRADRGRRLSREEGRRRRAEEARRRAEKQELALEEAEQARVRDFWDALSPVERDALREEAIARGNTFLVGQYRRLQASRPDSENLYLKTLIDTHIVRILEGDGSAGAGLGSAVG